MVDNVLTGGAKLDKHLGKIAKNAINTHELHVGFLSNATYPDGTLVAAVASWQEFGTKTIPSRSFFRSMIKSKSPGWGKSAAKILKENNYDAMKTFQLMGMGIKGQLQQSIIDVLSPPLSPITLMLRKMKMQTPDLVITGATVGEAAARVMKGESTVGVSTKPLVDSAVMLHAVDFEVV